MSGHSAENDALDEQECGYVYDHDIETTYEGEDGWHGICRECGAELWEEPEDTPIPPASTDTTGGAE